MILEVCSNKETFHSMSEKTPIITRYPEDRPLDEDIGRYQISSTSTVIASGLPWFAVWIVDTKTGEVKWVDHPNIPDQQQQYGKPFTEMQRKPGKGT